MKRISVIVVLIFSLRGFAQQTPSYTQFVLNQYALNPAVAGTNQGIEVVAGARVQWWGFENAPTTNFASITFGWRKNFSYKGKHGIGLFAEDDRQGTMFASKAAYVSYSYHLRVFTGLNIAAGIFAGVRTIGINQLLYDATDPALAFSKSYVTLYPDLIPGMRFYTRKLFIDVSSRQLYKNSVEQGSTKLGSRGVRLDPTFLLSVKRRIYLGDNTWMLMPALNVQSTYKSLPFVQANCMLFYAKRIGVGGAIRNNSFASAIFQVKPAKNWLFGVAYDYSINRMRAVAANSVEIILVFSPAAHGDEREFQVRKVANCPDFDF